MAAPTKTNPSDKFFRTDHLRVNLSGRTARGGAVAISSQALKFVITIGATSVMARLLTPSRYGPNCMVGFVTRFGGGGKDLGLSTATIQKSEISFEQTSTLFWINALLSLGITLFTAAIAPLVAWFYGEPRLDRKSVV